MKPQLVALALSLIMISAGDTQAQPGEGTVPCITGHRFGPGPIVNGHHRQPTSGEIESRTQQLRAWSTKGARSCLAASAGSETFMPGPPNNGSPHRIVELDTPFSQRLE
jgi:hypothetical protein